MIAVAIASAAAVFALLHLLGRLSSQVRPVSWPGEAPAGLHEGRARDQHLTHLARLLAADDPTEAHRVVVGIVDRLLETTYVDDPGGATATDLLGSRVARFLARPPLGSPARYRRELDVALGRIEALR